MCSDVAINVCRRGDDLFLHFLVLGRSWGGPVVVLSWSCGVRKPTEIYSDLRWQTTVSWVGDKPVRNHCDHHVSQHLHHRDTRSLYSVRRTISTTSTIPTSK